MNQSNKKNLEFIINSGVNYFLQDSPRSWFENEKKLQQSDFNKDTGEFAISLIRQNTDDFLHGTSNNPRPMRRKFWNETEKTKN